MTNIEPCPNPGCADDKLGGRVTVASFPPPFRAVFCPVCQMRGPGRRTDAEAIEVWNPIARAARDQRAISREPRKLWLWKNFVDGAPEYWAFDNPYPIFLDSSDPQVLGEPCGYALLKPSRDGRS